MLIIIIQEKTATNVIIVMLKAIPVNNKKECVRMRRSLAKLSWVLLSEHGLESESVFVAVVVFYQSAFSYLSCIRIRKGSKLPTNLLCNRFNLPNMYSKLSNYDAGAMM